MKFKWNLQPEFERYKKEQKMYKEDEEGNGEYVRSVRTGNLCFDMINWGNHLWFDLYVGGVDSGYGYGVNDYPYDYCNEASFRWNKDLTNVSDEEFEKESEEYIEEFINVKKEYTTDIKAIHVNLLDKANEELRVW